VEPLGDEPDIYSFKVGDDKFEAKKPINKWNNSARKAQLKARWSSGYIDSLLEGTPCKRQVIAQAMTAEEFERRKTVALERLEAEAEAERRAARRGNTESSAAAKPDKKDKDKKEKKGGKGQQASGKAEMIKAEADKKRQEKNETAKTAQLEYTKKNAPKDLKTDVDALIKHLEELRICAQRCVDDGTHIVAVEAELTALRHVMDACKRDKKEELLLARHVKRGFVVIQRLLCSCRAHITADKAQELADITSCLGFTDLAKVR
jgi:hypothetical protein